MWWFTMDRSRKNASMSSRTQSPPDDEAVGFRDAGRAADAGHADDPPLLDRALDPLENLDDRVAPPDLRELVLRDPEALQAPLRPRIGTEPVLWYELVLQDVEPQGSASLGDLS